MHEICAKGEHIILNNIFVFRHHAGTTPIRIMYAREDSTFSQQHAIRVLRQITAFLIDTYQQSKHKTTVFYQIVCAHSKNIVPLHRQKKHSKDCLG